MVGHTKQCCTDATLPYEGSAWAVWQAKDGGVRGEGHRTIIAEKLFKVFKPDMSRYDAQVKAQESARKEMKRELTEQLTEQLSESIMTQARANMEVELRGQICEQTSDAISMHVQETQEGLEKVRCDSLRLIASEGIGLT